MPKAIKLLIWGATDGLASSSPYCLKVLRALDYKKLSFETLIAKGPPKGSAHGKLPIAEIDGIRVEDSTRILKALDEAFPDSRKVYPADPALRADTLLLEEWSDEYLTPFVATYRWLYDHHFNKFAKQSFAAIPAPIRLVLVPSLRKAFLNQLKDRGIALDTEHERRKQFEECIWILEQKLAKNPFLLTSEPTAADFAVHATLRVILSAKLGEISPFIERSAPVMKWIATLEKPL